MPDGCPAVPGIRAALYGRGRGRFFAPCGRRMAFMAQEGFVFGTVRGRFFASCMVPSVPEKAAADRRMPR